MANTIKIKRRTSGTGAPTTDDIVAGELAFVDAAEKLYYRAGNNIIEIGGSGAFLKSNASDTMNGDLTVTGNLTVEGTTTTVDSTTVSIADSQFEIASTNNNDGDNGVVTDAVDFGTYGNYNSDPGDTNATAYAGWFRDASDNGEIKFYSGLGTEPTTTVDTTDAGYTAATVTAGTFKGNLAGSPTITSATIDTSLDMNGTELILDADGDTSITADTDDQIDIKIGGTDELNITGTEIKPATTGGIALGTSDKKFGAIFGGAATVSSVSTSGQITSTVTTNTAPLVIASQTKVENLNADLLDGKHAPTGAIIGTTDTQTMSNKTLTTPTLTTPKINDTSEDHTYNLAVSELTDNRTITLPLLTSNDTFVFANHTQTLDNKTIDCGTFSGS